MPQLMGSMLFYLFLWQQTVGHSLFPCGEVFSTWNWLLYGWKHSTTICHGLIQTVLEQGEALQHLQYADDIMMWDKSMREVFEKELFGLLSYLKSGFGQNKARSKDLLQRPSLWK